MTNSELVKASSVLMGNGESHEDMTETWQALNPCPSCGVTPYEAPEGVTIDGKPRWQYDHCWKCGFRPGSNEAVDMNKLRKQFEQFQQFVNNQPEMQHPTLSPPATEDDRQALIDRINQLESERRSSNAVDAAVSDATPAPGVSDGGNV